MKITPIAAAPTGAGSDPDSYHAANPTKVLLRAAPGDGVDVRFQVQTAAVSLRPYFWQPVPGHADGGAWVGLGFDSASGVGASPATAEPGVGNDCAHGRFQGWDWGVASLILVAADGLVANVKWAALDVVRRGVVTT